MSHPRDDHGESQSHLMDDTANNSGHGCIAQWRGSMLPGSVSRAAGSRSTDKPVVHRGRSGNSGPRVSARGVPGDQAEELGDVERLVTDPLGSLVEDPARLA